MLYKSHPLKTKSLQQLCSVHRLYFEVNLNDEVRNGSHGIAVRFQQQQE